MAAVSKLGAIVRASGEVRGIIFADSDQSVIYCWSLGLVIWLDSFLQRGLLWCENTRVDFEGLGTILEEILVWL